MSKRAIVWAFETKCPSPYAKLVLLKLAYHADEFGVCWPSQSAIGLGCGITRESVNRQIKLLAEAGLIRVESRVNEIGRLSNRYFMLCDTNAHSGYSDVTPHVTLDHKPSDVPSHSTFAETTPLLPDDPVSQIFNRGLLILGPKRRSLLGKMRRDHGDEAVLAAIVTCENEQPSEPASFFIACMSRAPPRNGNGKHPGTYRPGAVAAQMEGVYNGTEDFIRRRHQADVEADQQSAVPLLDGERAGGGARTANNGLARRPR